MASPIGGALFQLLRGLLFLLGAISFLVSAACLGDITKFGCPLIPCEHVIAWCPTRIEYRQGSRDRRVLKWRRRLGVLLCRGEVTQGSGRSDQPSNAALTLFSYDGLID